MLGSGKALLVCALAGAALSAILLGGLGWPNYPVASSMLHLR